MEDGVAVVLRSCLGVKNTVINNFDTILKVLLFFSAGKKCETGPCTISTRKKIHGQGMEVGVALGR